MKKIIYALLLLSTQLYAADTYHYGKIVDITTITDGLLIKMENLSVPDACKNRNPYGWILVPNERKAIMAVMLMNWYQKKTIGTVYVDSAQTNNYYCTVSQFDPEN
ncbi:ABC transporter ATP-binding protein [Acinetobacter bereziniae]|uniref:ABC transporter ATP-binding protein n=1 Tax=Acinetobacter bereziniae TaxID=106648 RepID=UPI001900BEE2|nr:ABC transporter ATP-binding protein [Acinetobacter bereziniae]MBJ9901590.1 ABC transporter ATP-binding protein [Acinetobacter bereziniae]MCU4318056.1 ABC transporter ATP-binding protein [Acinetobacter bereziniae]MCU4598586.1 ABC transporter ATP-binding protein [Acinetobacter bereziniae]